jgi:xanthine/uracil permease
MIYFIDICENLAPLIKLVKFGLIPILQIGIPIILIVLGMIDLGKAVMAGKEEEMKKAQSALIKRCIYAVAVFFVVTIVTLLFNLLITTGAATTDTNGNASNDSISIQENWLTCWDNTTK